MKTLYKKICFNAYYQVHINEFFHSYNAELDDQPVAKVAVLCVLV